MNACLLSVVVAVKEWNAIDIQRLVCSLSSQPLANEIQLIVVYSDHSPKLIVEKFSANISSVKYLHSAPKGVYAAFSVGVDFAEGDYILFSGGDDFFMPGLNEVMKNIMSAKEDIPDVVVSTVCFGNEKLLIPIKTKLGIILRNWCQQGVFYRKHIFKKFQFDSNYPIQADHKLNIEILGSRLNIHYSKSITAYFSCGGMSQTQPDINFWKDMPSLISTNFGLAYGLICHLRRVFGYIFYGSPNKRFKKLQ